MTVVFSLVTCDEIIRESSPLERCECGIFRRDRKDEFKEVCVFVCVCGGGGGGVLTLRGCDLGGFNIDYISLYW